MLEDTALVMANSADRETLQIRVVILANREKAEMDRSIQELISRGEFKDVAVICRSGDPTSLQDQEMVAISHANKVIILSSDDPSLDPTVADNLTFATTLALKHIRGGQVPTIVEIRGRTKALISSLGKNVVQVRARNFVSPARS